MQMSLNVEQEEVMCVGQLLTFLLTRKLPVTASPWVKLSMQLASRFKYPLVCVRWNMKPLLFTFPLISQNCKMPHQQEPNYTPVKTFFDTTIPL